MTLSAWQLFRRVCNRKKQKKNNTIRRFGCSATRTCAALTGWSSDEIIPLWIKHEIEGILCVCPVENLRQNKEEEIKGETNINIHANIETEWKENGMKERTLKSVKSVTIQSESFVFKFAKLNEHFAAFYKLTKCFLHLRRNKCGSSIFSEVNFSHFLMFTWKTCWKRRRVSSLNSTISVKSRWSWPHTCSM